MQPKTRASNQMVAQRAGVSAMTVSRVVQGRRDLVKPDTYERVLAAMEELNYVPVRLTMQNRHVPTNTIGLVPTYRAPTRSLIDSFTYAGICDRAAAHGFDIFTMLRPEAEWMANRSEMRFLDRRSDGFIFISPGCGEWTRALESLVEHEIPAVVCYRRDVPEGVAWVDPDNEAIIQLAVECLTRRGHSKIAYFATPNPGAADRDLLADLSGERAMFDDVARRRCFTRTMRDAGHEEYCECFVEAARWPLDVSVAQALFESGATGVVVGNDALAMQLWDVATAMGLRVPGELSIVSIDDHPGADYRGLTSVAFGYDEVGRLAVETWVKLNQGTAATDCCRVVPVHLVERASVREPRG
jgi:DNA-binding LacI/PurR family transcriptional regulator